jgi:hypothetical protein
MKGACLSISSGENVDIWDSPWIPSLPTFKPQSNVNLLDLLAFLVADLFMLGERSWNTQLLGDLFEPSMVQSILSIYLPQINSPD